MDEEHWFVHAPHLPSTLVGYLALESAAPGREAGVDVPDFDR